jgi:hypothetical protein
MPVEYKLATQLESVLPKGMTIPDEIRLLYQWIEDNGYFSDDRLFVERAGTWRNGFLYPDKELRDSWTDTQREGGTIIDFFAGGDESLKHWFGKEEHEEPDEEIKNSLCVFARSGAEGSLCAFWLTEENALKIVHLGSGSGSCLFCVLANNALDFLRLLAIGYDEICWDEDFPYPPNENGQDFFVAPNTRFQAWVKSTFHVEIPNTALEIVKFPATMNDSSSQDAFFTWYQKFLK